MGTAARDGALNLAFSQSGETFALPKHPNILLFLTDDHAQWVNGAYGDPEIITPNLDSLAEQGVPTENAYTPTPVRCRIVTTGPNMRPKSQN
ncbi:sulfatase-like hydrolase/transferase [bacterium]|nr:sulfatase-like hydrolase/transferase [bacterium]